MLHNPASPHTTKALAIALIVLGIVAIALPFISGLAMTYLFSVAIALAGVMHFCLAFRHQRIGSRIWHVVAALFLIGGGGLLIAMPVNTMESFTLVLAWLFLIVGLMRIFGWFAVRAIQGAVLMLLDGIVTVLIGIALMVMWPTSSLWAIGTLVGVSLIFNGWAVLRGIPASNRRK